MLSLLCFSCLYISWGKFISEYVRTVAAEPMVLCVLCLSSGKEALEQGLNSSSSGFSPVDFQEVAGTDVHLRPRHWKHHRAQGCGRLRKEPTSLSGSEGPIWYHSWCLGAWDTGQNEKRLILCIEVCICSLFCWVPVLKYNLGWLSTVLLGVCQTADLAGRGRTWRKGGWQNEGKNCRRDCACPWALPSYHPQSVLGHKPCTLLCTRKALLVHIDSIRAAICMSAAQIQVVSSFITLKSTNTKK